MDSRMIIDQTEEGGTAIETRLEGDTVWLAISNTNSGAVSERENNYIRTYKTHL